MQLATYKMPEFMHTYVHSYISIHNNLYFMQQPEIDSCSMLAIKHYDVIVYSDEGEIITSGITDVNSITLSIKHNNTASTVNVTVTVVDIEGQRSTTTSLNTVIINATHCQNTNSSEYATTYVA